MPRDYSVSIVKCATYSHQELFPKVKEAIELIGGIEKFVKPNSKVLVKPNLLMAIEPQRAITTHPEFVRAVIRILRAGLLPRIVILNLWLLVLIVRLSLYLFMSIPTMICLVGKIWIV